MTNYHANPYDQAATGFYFDDYASYLAQAKNHKNEYGDPVEEYIIENINGTNHQLFNALGINQANLQLWFENLESIDGDDLIRAIYLAEFLNTDMSEIMDRLDEVALFEGRADQYAEEYIEDCGLLDGMPENLRFYFDVDAFARDMLLSGDISEVEINNTTYVIWGC